MSDQDQATANEATSRDSGALGDSELAALCEVWAAASAKWRAEDDARGRLKARALLGEPIEPKDIVAADRACMDAVMVMSRAEAAVIREASKRIAVRSKRAA